MSFASIPILLLGERHLSLSPGVLASSTCPETASRFSYVIFSDDQLACFLIMEFFKTARLCFTIDLARSQGRGRSLKKKEDTIMPWLEINGIIHLTNFPKSPSSSGIQVVATVPVVKLQIRPLTKSLTLISLSRFQTHSGVLVNTARVDLKKQALGVCILQKGIVSTHQLALDLQRSRARGDDCEQLAFPT